MVRTKQKNRRRPTVYMQKILKKQTVYNMKNIRYLRNIDKLILEKLLYTFQTIVILTPLNSRDAHIQIFLYTCQDDVKLRINWEF